MRRLPLILGLALVVAMTVREVYAFLVTNEGVRHFSTEPRRLWYVLLLGVAGGMVAFGISCLSPGSQRTLKPVVLGILGVVLIAGFGLFAYSVTGAALMVTVAGMWGLVVALLTSFAVIAGLVRLAFRQVWRQTSGERPTRRCAE